MVHGSFSPVFLATLSICVSQDMTKHASAYLFPLLVCSAMGGVQREKSYTYVLRPQQSGA